MLSVLWLALPMVAAIVVSGWCAYVGERWAVVVLVLLAVEWLRIDKRFEGPTLVRLTAHHGLVLSDLVAVIAVAVAAMAVRRQRSRVAASAGREVDSR